MSAIISSVLCVIAALAIPAIYIHSKIQPVKATKHKNPNENESYILRSNLSTTLVSSVNAPTETMHDVLKESAKKYPGRRQFGSRELIRTHQEEKNITRFINGNESIETKTWSFNELSGYSYMTYTEIEKTCLTLGSGLVNLGVTHRMTLFGPTCKEWSLTAYGILMMILDSNSILIVITSYLSIHFIIAIQLVGLKTSP